MGAGSRFPGGAIHQAACDPAQRAAFPKGIIVGAALGNYEQQYECFIETTLLRADHATGCLVGAAGLGFSWPERVRRLFDVGGASGQALLFRALPIAVLFARDLWLFVSQSLRTEAGLVARLAIFFAFDVDSLGAGFISFNLLLLSRRLLQSLLGRSCVVRGGGTAQDLPRRTLVSAHPAKCA